MTREAVDAMDNDDFELYLKYHFVTWEQEDLLEEPEKHFTDAQDVRIVSEVKEK
ncbi:MAG: hypothetical protein Q4F05_18880 [bacterium]|nr:hypothetical protein [bacterium]